MKEDPCHIERPGVSTSTVEGFSSAVVNELAAVESGLEATELGAVELAVLVDAVEEADDDGPVTEGVLVVRPTGAGDKYVRRALEGSILRLWRLIG